MDKQDTCFFTGHREIDDSYEETEQKVYFVSERLYEAGYRNFITGGAIGFDTLAAKVVLKLRAIHPDVRLHICIPCNNQDKYFTPEQKAEYNYLLENADSHEVLYEHYVRGCMHTRNRKMADSSSVCIAYCKKQTGGTAYTVGYAVKKGLQIIYI